MFSDNQGESECTTSLDAMIQNTVDMESLIKKNFMIQSEKLKYFAENNSVQMSLREEVEELNKEREELRLKVKGLNQQLYSQNNNEKDDKMDKDKIIEGLKTTNTKHELHIKDLEEKIEQFKAHQVD